MIAASIIVLVGIAAFLVFEWGLRLAGLADYPLYKHVQPEFYRSASSQKGRFRNRFTWQYDHLGMRSSAELESIAGATILVGDSVVDGGMNLDQSETLTSRVRALTGRTVYPVACHGWSLANEMLALQAMPEWESAEALVWLINPGDLDNITRGDDQFSFPTVRPRLLLPWIFARTVKRHASYRPLASNPLRDQINKEFRSKLKSNFVELANQFLGKIVIIEYPMAIEIIPEESFCQNLAALVEGATLIRLQELPSWTVDCYFDHIHPNSLGLSLLSEIIQGALLCPQPNEATQ